MNKGELPIAILDAGFAGIGQARMPQMVWHTCQSWYGTADGRNHALYPGFAAEYALRTRRFRPRDYERVES